MRSVTPMRAAKTGYIIMSVLLCVLGVVLFVWPGVSVAVIGELLGIGMIVFGAVKVAGYLSRDLFRLAFQYDLAFGVLLIALGIVTLTHPGETIGQQACVAQRGTSPRAEHGRVQHALEPVVQLAPVGAFPGQQAGSLRLHLLDLRGLQPRLLGLFGLAFPVLLLYVRAQ